MNLLSAYPEIKLVHVVAASTSGLLFLLRATAVQLHANWAMKRPTRYLSYTIDTVLLVSALMLMSLSRQYPIAASWLTVKVGLVLLYIVLGSLALKRARTRAARLICACAALLVFGAIIAVARTHDPWGPLLWLTRS